MALSNEEEVLDIGGDQQVSERPASFEDEQVMSGAPVYEEESRNKMAEFLVKYSGGLIKNEDQATYVLLGFVVAGLLLIMLLIFGGEPKQSVPEGELYYGGSGVQ